MKKSAIIGLILVAICIAAIVGTFTDTGSYSNFSEAKSMGSETHIVGVLNKDKEQFYDPLQDANAFSFYMIDEKGVECKVIFKGAKPQDFERSEQIVITGKMEGDYFAAQKILMKCPSKYNNTEVTAS
jgi:cytochrome c-type biogenesis protein CcmE